MSAREQQVLQDALGLPPTERAELIEELFRSLERPSQEGPHALWARECEDRIDAYDEGEIKAVTARQVFERVDRDQPR